MPRITLRRGDITKEKTEAIVNAANNYLRMGGGVAGAIAKAGGREIEEEAMKKGPIPIGEAVTTGAGRLPTRYVIHAAVMGLDSMTDEGKIKAATRNSLLRAKELGLKSIAYPALGTGVGRFPYREAASIMIAEAQEHLKGETYLEEIVFVLHDRKAHSIFAEVLGGSEAVVATKPSTSKEAR